MENNLFGTRPIHIVSRKVEFMEINEKNIDSLSKVCVCIVIIVVVVFIIIIIINNLIVILPPPLPPFHPQLAQDRCVIYSDAYQGNSSLETTLGVCQARQRQLVLRHARKSPGAGLLTLTTVVGL